MIRSRGIVRFLEHEINEAVDEPNDFKFRRMLHLGSMKGCPTCKQIREKGLSQVREYRLSMKRGELLHAIASHAAMEDNHRQRERWEVDYQFSKLFNSVYPIEARSDAKRQFILKVREDIRGVGEMSETERDDWYRLQTQELEKLNVEEI